WVPPRRPGRLVAGVLEVLLQVLTAAARPPRSRHHRRWQSGSVERVPGAAVVGEDPGRLVTQGGVDAGGPEVGGLHDVRIGRDHHGAGHAPRMAHPRYLLLLTIG